MKQVLLYFAIVTATIQTIKSQTVAGNYASKWVSVNNEILELTIELDADYTFTFQYYQTFVAPNPEKHIYG